MFIIQCHIWGLILHICSAHLIFLTKGFCLLILCLAFRKPHLLFECAFKLQCHVLHASLKRFPDIWMSVLVWLYLSRNRNLHISLFFLLPAIIYCLHTIESCFCILPFFNTCSRRFYSFFFFLGLISTQSHQTSYIVKNVSGDNKSW